MNRLGRVCIPIAAMLAAACAGPRVIEIDHANRTVRFGDRPIDTGATIRVDRADSLRIVIKNTNTALYDYVVTSERVDNPDAAALNALGSAFGPYLPMMARDQFSPEGLRRDPVAAAASGCMHLVDPLAQLDRHIQRVIALDVALLTRADSLRRDTSQAAMEWARGGLDVPPADELIPLYSQLSEIIENPYPCADTAFLSAAREALADAPAAIQRSWSAGAGKREIDAAATSRELRGDSLGLPELSVRDGAKITVTIKPDDHPLLGWGAERDPLTVSVTAHRRWILGMTPTATLGFTWAPDVARLK